MWVALRRAGTLVLTQTWRWTELLQMLEVTTTGSHAGSQVLTHNVRILILSAAEIFPTLSAMSS